MARTRTPEFVAEHLTREEVTTLFTNAMREIEQRMLVGHINHVIDPARQDHYAEGGAHDQGSQILTALKGALNDTLEYCD